jgi:hypothetical protein
VFVEGVPDREVAVREDGPTDRTLDALVVGRLVDDEVLDALELLPVARNRALPVWHCPRNLGGWA